MGVILWEDSIQRGLKQQGLYVGVTALSSTAKHGTHVEVFNTEEDRKAHISYAVRRSRYFAHTRKGKQYAARPVVRVDVGDNFRPTLGKELKYGRVAP